MPDERKTEQIDIGSQPLADLVVAETHVSEASVPVGSRRFVEQCPRPQPLGEATELGRCDRSLAEVHERDRDPAFLEESDRRPGGPVARQAEDLDEDL